MNPIDAIRLMCKFYPGGVDALAVLCGKSGETLRKEIANASGYKLGVLDACTISEACIAIGSEHCHAYANAVAANCGGFVQLPVREMGAPHNIHGAAAGLVKETADVVGAIAAAMADNVISENERKTIEKELRELLEQIQRVSAGVQHETARSLRSVP
jgi:uncharacterized membrane protein YebE (DUF533 family)